MYKSYDRLLPADDSKPARNSYDSSPSSGDEHNITIGELARDSGVTLRALRFYQSKGLLTPRRDGAYRIFCGQDRAQLALIQQGKRLGFTLSEIRSMLGSRRPDSGGSLAISRKKCVEQIKLLESQRHAAELALAELRRIYTAMSLSNADVTAKLTGTG